MIIGKDKNAALIERFVRMLRSRLSHPLIAVDDRLSGLLETPLSTINIIDADNELILAQQVIGEKNHEITHASKLIDTLDIRGEIVTADALNTQTVFATKIIDEKADYCPALGKRPRRQNYEKKNSSSSGNPFTERNP